MENEELLTLEPRLYEVGYHILPTVAEEDIPGQTTVVRNAIESHGGTVVGSGMPVLTQLAYPLPKVIANKRTAYTSAYFGWMKFEMAPGNAESFKKELDGTAIVLRFIIIKAIKDKPPVSSEKMAFMSEDSKSKSEGKEVPEGKNKSVSAASEAELDKTIDELVIE